MPSPCGLQGNCNLNYLKVNTCLKKMYSTAAISVHEHATKQWRNCDVQRHSIRRCADVTQNLHRG